MRARPRRGELAAYAIASLALWPFPLLNRLHAESSAVLAVVSFFVAGLAALAALREEPRSGAGWSEVVAGRMAALLLPLLLAMVPMVWAPNCGWLAGIGFFVLFPGVTVVLAVAVAAWLHANAVRRPGVWLTVTGVAILVAGPLYDLGLHPQFYSYNHVFGGILGPIYDEELAIRPGLFVFRGLTLLWAAGALAAARRRHRLVLVIGAAVALVYAFGGRLGINTTYGTLERALPGAVHTEHVEIRFDPERTPEDRVRRVRDLAVVSFERLEGLLEVQPAGRTLILLYPDAHARALLTGARHTSVAPVWLRRPQIHLEAGTFDRVLPHELAHVFSREFGLPLLRASLAVGLVEGLAVALEPPDSSPSPHELVLAARTATGVNPGAALPDALSPLGFWTGRGGVSYTVSGSFVGYLIAAYGAERIKRAYARGDFAGVYGLPVDSLVSGWLDHIANRRWVDAGSVTRARARLGAPSLFERVCPHFVPPPLRAARRAVRRWERGEDSLQEIGRALERWPLSPSVMTAWTRLNLEAGNVVTVGDSLSARSVSTLGWGLRLVRADYLAMSGSSDSAAVEYRNLLQDLDPSDREDRMLLVLRLEAVSDPSTAAWLLARDPSIVTDSAPGKAIRYLIMAREGSIPDGVPPDSLLLPGWAMRMWPPRRDLARAQAAYARYEHLEAAEYAARAAAGYRDLGDLTMALYVETLAATYRRAASLPSIQVVTQT